MSTTASARREVYSLTPQTRAQQHLHGDPHEKAVVVLGGAQQLGGGSVVQGLGQGVVLAGQVSGEHRHPWWRLGPAPLIDPDEEHPQRAEPVRERGGGGACLVLSGTAGEPGLEVLDVPPAHLRGAHHVRCGFGEEAGEGA
jgi:hypothetical protein